MIHVIYTPAVDELLPEESTCVTTSYDGNDAVSCLVPDEFITDGTVHYKCTASGEVLVGDRNLVQDTFSGW